MEVSGNLHKMVVTHSSPVTYELPVGDEKIKLNPYIGKKIGLTHSGDIHCIACGRKTSKSFSQGYCFPCMRSLARCDSCIIKPEQRHYDEGTCREPDWAEANCLQPHYVYLANSSGAKVGITRGSQVPTRWIDQGAVAAMPILKVSTRLIAGLAEVAIKKNVSDRTDWRRMLKGRPDPIDFVALRTDLLAASEAELGKLEKRFGDDAIIRLQDDAVSEIDYPVDSYPTKVTSFNFDKTPEVGGVLQGIKGQYLIFDGGVINIRKFGGYHITFSAD
jgi:hypothetical protein